MRIRHSVKEMYSYNVKEISELVLQAIEYYIKVDQITRKTAQEMALSDYMFWYNNDEEKRRELERIIYS